MARGDSNPRRPDDDSRGTGAPDGAGTGTYVFDLPHVGDGNALDEFVSEADRGAPIFEFVVEAPVEPPLPEPVPPRPVADPWRSGWSREAIAVAVVTVLAVPALGVALFMFLGQRPSGEADRGTLVAQTAAVSENTADRRLMSPDPGASATAPAAPARPAPATPERIDARSDASVSRGREPARAAPSPSRPAPSSTRPAPEPSGAAGRPASREPAVIEPVNRPRPASDRRPHVPAPPPPEHTNAAAPPAAVPDPSAPVGAVGGGPDADVARGTVADGALATPASPEREPDAAPTHGNVAEAVVPAVRAPVPSPADVRRTLTTYEDAFSTLDVAAAQAVWPSVDRQALERAFQNLETQQLVLRNCRIDIDEVRASATCGGTLRYVPRIGSKTERVERREFTFELSLDNDAWSIDRVESR